MFIWKIEGNLKLNFALSPFTQLNYPQKVILLSRKFTFSSLKFSLQFDLRKMAVVECHRDALRRRRFFSAIRSRTSIAAAALRPGP